MPCVQHFPLVESQEGVSLSRLQQHVFFPGYCWSTPDLRALSRTGLLRFTSLEQIPNGFALCYHTFHETTLAEWPGWQDRGQLR